MNLKSIELINFQAHTERKVDFTDGINILTGPSGVGKSCIRRAIEWCLFNISVDGVRKEGTKKTSVKIELDNSVTIERVRSASINRYVMIKKGEEKVFDSIGKTLPEEIKDAIGINPIEVEGEELWLNSAPQIALPFLFDKSPTWRMKLFNKLTGNDLLDKLFVQFNKDILRIGREHKSDTERLEKLTSDFQKKEIEKEQLEAIHGVVKKQIENLRIKQEKYDNLLELKDLQQKNKTSINELNAKKIDVKFPQDTEIKELTTKIDNVNIKEKLLEAVLSNDNEISRVSTELSDIALPELNSEEIACKIDTVDTINRLLKDQINTKLMNDNILSKIADADSELKEYTKQLNELLENTENCPLCGQGLTENCKHQLKA